MTWTQTLIPPQTTILEAIDVIQKGQMQIGLVVDSDRKLLGTVTDGDIRRAILKRVPLESTIDIVMNTQPVTAIEGTEPAALLDVLTTRVLHQIPILDGDNRVVDLVTIDDLIAAKGARENWVVLMAGGLGNRLRPLTEEMPKPLIEVGNKPILETTLEQFIDQGFRRFYISVNYKAELVKAHFGDGGRWNAEIRYLHEHERMGTAGPLGLIDEPPEHPVFVMNGDLLTKVDFKSLASYHREQRSEATMCVREYDFQVPFGVVEIENNTITGIDEKPQHRFFVNAGIYVINPDLLDLIPKGRYFDMTDFFDLLVKAGHDTAGFPIQEFWLDIGRPDDLRQAHTAYEQHFE